MRLAIPNQTAKPIPPYQLAGNSHNNYARDRKRSRTWRRTYFGANRSCRYCIVDLRNRIHIAIHHNMKVFCESDWAADLHFWMDPHCYP